MFGFVVPLLVAALVVALVVTRQQHHHSVRAAGGPPLSPPSTRPASLGSARRTNTDLERWVHDGLITTAQAEAIIAHDLDQAAARGSAVAPVDASHRRIPVVAETLGYLGGMLGVAGVSAMLSNFWSDLGTGGRLAVVVVGVVVFTAAGLVVRDTADPALLRLRGFLWLVATAAASLTGLVVARDLLHTEHDSTVAFAIVLSGTLLSTALWQGKRRLAQQATTMAGAVATLGTGCMVVADARLAGPVVWAGGLGLVTYALVRRTPTVWATLVVGAVAMFVGSLIPTAQWQAACSLWALGTALAIFGLPFVAAAPLADGERTMLIVLGAIAGLNTLPNTLAYWSTDAGIVTGVVLWGAGAALLAAALWRGLRAQIFLQVAGGVAVIGGAALTGRQSVAFATLFGLATAVTLLGLGMLPRRVLLSVFGSAGLLVNVPWSIQHFFPGEGRAPLLIAASGVVLVLVAVLLTRMSNRFRTEVHN